LFFIFQPLGDRREKAAYRTLAKILRLPDEHPAVVTAPLAISSPMTAADQISIFSAISNSIIDLDAKTTNRNPVLRMADTIDMRCCGSNMGNGTGAGHERRRRRVLSRPGSTHAMTAKRRSRTLSWTSWPMISLPGWQIHKPGRISSPKLANSKPEKW
jgi:hypothetical protein